MIAYIVLFCLLLLSVISDLIVSKIRNVFVLTAVILGMAINTYQYGLTGLKTSIIGIVLPILLLGVLFYARLIGAGDIKLFSAIGAILGWKYLLYVMAYSFIVAGVFAFISLVRREEVKSTFFDFYLDMKMCFLTYDILYFHNNSTKHIIRLSPAIALGTCVQMLLCLI